MNGLERFIEVQKRDYQLALDEVRAGKKQGHWIWYIFPQMYGLGRSYFAQLYGISDREEAVAYLNHEVLGPRLREITCALLEHDDYSAEEIFGDLDAMKYNEVAYHFALVAGGGKKILTVGNDHHLREEPLRAAILTDVPIEDAKQLVSVLKSGTYSLHVTDADYLPTVD